VTPTAATTDRLDERGESQDQQAAKTREHFGGTNEFGDTTTTHAVVARRRRTRARSSRGRPNKERERGGEGEKQEEKTDTTAHMVSAR